MAVFVFVAGWWTCIRLHALKRCPQCRHRSEVYEDHTGRRQCGWWWLRETGQADRLLGLSPGRR